MGNAKLAKDKLRRSTDTRKPTESGGRTFPVYHKLPSRSPSGLVDVECKFCGLSSARWYPSIGRMTTHHRNTAGTHFRCDRWTWVSEYSLFFEQSQEIHPQDPTSLVYPEFPNLQSRTHSGTQHTAWFLRSGSSLIVEGYKIPAKERLAKVFDGRWPHRRPTLNTRSVSFPPWSSLRKVGLFLPLIFWSIGSRVLMVLDNGLAFTTQTSVLPRQTPVLKKVMCEAIRLARFSPARGSIWSRASRGKVMT